MAMWLTSGALIQEDGAGTVKGKGFKRICYNEFVTLVKQARSQSARQNK